MSRQAVQRYQNEITQLIQYGGTSKESAIRGAFERLLNEYCRQKDFLLIIELLAKVTTVSVETMQLIDALAAQSPLRTDAKK